MGDQDRSGWESRICFAVWRPFVVNFPTKGHWRSASRLDDIVRGLDYLESHHKQWGITSIAVPSLGCQHGKLEWQIVLPVLHEHLRRLDIPVELYIPAEASLDEALSVLGIEKATHRRVRGGSGHSQLGRPRMD